MTNPYNMAAYQVAPNQNGYYGEMQKRKKGPSTFGMATLGLIGGSTVGLIKKNYPVSNNYAVSDSFVKQVYENHANANFSKADKKIYDQTKAIINRIDNMKTTESLKRLLKENKEAFEKTPLNGSGLSLNDTLKSLNPDNLEATKKSIKSSLSSGLEAKHQQMKNIIANCWDAEKKKFIKPEGFNQKIFNVIEKTKVNNKMKTCLKYGGIGAAILGGLTIGYKLLTPKKDL